MSLDQTSLAIGQLQAAQKSTADAVGEVKDDLKAVNEKLDKLLARDVKARFTMKNWATLITAASAGAGGIAHALSRVFGS